MPQEGWAKAAVASGRMILATGEKGVEMIKNVEETGERITPHSFKVLENMTVPADYDALIENMDPALGRPTSARMRNVIMSILRSGLSSWFYVST